MSGEFRDEQQQSIESTDNPDLARRFGLTSFDRETGLYTAPTPPDAGERDSGQLAAALTENAQLSDEVAQLTRQRDESAAEADRLREQLKDWPDQGSKTTGTRSRGGAKGDDGK